MSGKKIVLTVAVGLTGIAALLVAVKVVQLQIGKRRVAKEMERAGPFPRLSPFGFVDRLSVLPVVDFYAESEDLRTEAGVCYLVEADDTTILMDVGANWKAEHPSAALHNLKALGVDPARLDMLFLTHLHADHLGGQTDEFSLSNGPVSLPAVPAYAPAPVSPSRWNPAPRVEVVREPKVLRPGIATIGAIPRYLFLLGYVTENAIAVNVEGKGIVLIVGCGHQGMENLIECVKALFEEPLYGVIGGLHLPARGGRLKLGPIDMQQLVASDTVSLRQSDEEVRRAIEALVGANPRFVALSPHDSSDWSIEQFKAAFGEAFHEIKAGRRLTL